MGCIDATAFNYNVDANTDDGSCVAVVVGCMDESAFNYNVDANTDDGSCVAVVVGCMDESAFNYNADANIDNGTCLVVSEYQYSMTVTAVLEYENSFSTNENDQIAVYSQDGLCVGVSYPIVYYRTLKC